MSDSRKYAVTQTAPPDTCLTGCLYQVVQATGLQGSNVLQLIPILKSKDNPPPVGPPPVVPGVSSPSLPQSVRIPLPLPVSSPSLVSPVKVPLVTQPILGNYIIATQRDLANTPKTIRVESRFSTPQDTAIILEKSQPITLPPNSPPGNPTFKMMNADSTSIHVKPTPLLPLGHRLQIPAHAEVKSVPASSLPLSIQQKILAQTGCSDLTKAPSVIYVSPVNTVKTLNQVTPLSPKPNAAQIALSAKSLPVVSTSGPTQTTARTDSPKGPMKWIVQETRESAACLVPVSSSNDTASKILQMLSGSKMEDIKLAHTDSSKVMQITDNALVMCNNKIFLLTKKGTELIDTGNKNPESPLLSPTKLPVVSETTKDLSNKVVEVVLSKNKLSPVNKQVLSLGNNTTALPNMQSPIKPNRTSLPLLPSRNRAMVGSITNNVDSGGTTSKCGLHNTTGANSADKGKPRRSSVQSSDQETVGLEGMRSTKITEAPAETPADDRYWRAKFGLVKTEKVVLQRVPLLQAESSQQSKRRPASAKKNAKDAVTQPRKRTSTTTETSLASKRTRADASQPSVVTAGLSGDLSSASPFSKPSSAAAETEAVWSPYGAEEASDAGIYLGQDITGHFSEVTLPRPRFRSGTLLSSYADETAKDEKIQRLKEVLKEREQALEALRRPKKP